MHIPESDWKILRKLREKALERFCDRILREISAVSEDRSLSSHDRYLRIYRLIEKRDKELGLAFDGPRRSAAIGQLITMVRLEAVKSSELEQFSEGTQQTVGRIIKEFG